MFSNLSPSSISFATVTPSLVVRGAPKLFSITTLRPLGPNVTFTASARMSTPRSNFSRASPPNFTSLAAMVFSYSDQLVQKRKKRVSTRLQPFRLFLGSLAAFDDAHDVGLLHDQELLAVDLHFGARPFAEQHEVTGFHFGVYAFARIIQRARAD